MKICVIRGGFYNNRAEGVMKIRVNPPNPRHPRCYYCRFGMDRGMVNFLGEQ